MQAQRGTAKLEVQTEPAAARVCSLLSPRSVRAVVGLWSVVVFRVGGARTTFCFVRHSRYAARSKITKANIAITKANIAIATQKVQVPSTSLRG